VYEERDISDGATAMIAVVAMTSRAPTARTEFAEGPLR
jgi:hypothetical protein